MLRNSKIFILPLAVSLFCLIGASNLKALSNASEISLDGQVTKVHFNDGDTFKAKDGEYAGKRFRIVGFNSLETYGLVHKWGSNSLEDLLKVANLATDEARRGEWHCTVEDGQDTWGRYLAVCHDLAHALLRTGLAHAYSIDHIPPQESYLNEQKAAQEEGLGMWAGGIPEYIITSLHSINEGHRHTYNRLISPIDGTSTQWHHQEAYQTCQEVCIEDSCMVFVPFNERYGRNKASCLYLNTP